MIFIDTKFQGVYIVVTEEKKDGRGSFIRTWCRLEFQKNQISMNIDQCNISFNKKKGTIRGLHYQTEPCQEEKLIRCLKGSIYDVIVDLRPDSQTYKQWLTVELTEENNKMIYIPKGFAHGFQTLENDTEILYFMNEFYHLNSASGVRWDDHAFNIKWPIPPTSISDKDRSYADFKG